MSGKRYSVTSINEVRLPPDLLKDMSMETLRTLDSQDEETFNEFVKELPLEDIKDAVSGCKRQQEVNRQLALENTEKEPQFTEAKEELRRLVTETSDLKTGYDRDYDELKRLQNRTELSTLRKQLQDATKLSETTSEDYASDFVSGKSSLSSVEEFVEGLVSQRSQYWLRKVKLEKFDDLAKNRRPVPVPRSRGPPSEVPSNSYYNAPQGSSLPVGSPSTMNAPTQSLPPYPTATGSGMPRPAQQPFPAAAYPGYQPSQQSVYPPPRQSFPQPQPVRPATGYSQAPPPRPAAYNQYRQHRY